MGAGKEGAWSDPVFCDVEASGLGERGYPIEVGWASVDAVGVIVRESHLIRPTEEWLASSGWDPVAEEIHGISLDLLIGKGRSAHEVALQMNRALAGREVHSDSPFDARWVTALFDEAGVEPAFFFSSKGADTVIVEYAAASGMGDLDYSAAEAEANRLAPRTHRAADDAAYLATFFKLVRDGFRAGQGALMSPGPWRMKP
jgi:hypothetical protein